MPRYHCQKKIGHANKPAEIYGRRRRVFFSALRGASELNELLLYTTTSGGGIGNMEWDKDDCRSYYMLMNINELVIDL